MEGTAQPAADQCAYESEHNIGDTSLSASAGQGSANGSAYGGNDKQNEQTNQCHKRFSFTVINTSLCPSNTRLIHRHSLFSTKSDN
jgi:hypothetical protein